MSQLIKSRTFKRLRSSLLSGLRWYISSCWFMRKTWTRPEGMPHVSWWGRTHLERQMLVYRDYFFWERESPVTGDKPNSSIQMGVSNIRKAFVSFSLPWWNWASSMNHYLLLDINCCSEYICKKIVAPPLLFAVLKYTNCEKNETQYYLFIKNCWISLIVLGWPWPAAHPAAFPLPLLVLQDCFWHFFGHSSLREYFCPFAFCPFLNALSQRCHQLRRGAQLCLALGPLQNRLEPAESSTGQRQPPLTEPTLRPRCQRLGTDTQGTDRHFSFCVSYFLQKGFLLYVLGRIQALGRMKWEGWKREIKPPCTGRSCDRPGDRQVGGGLENKMSPPGRNLWKYREEKPWSGRRYVEEVFSCFWIATAFLILKII